MRLAERLLPERKKRGMMQQRERQLFFLKRTHRRRNDDVPALRRLEKRVRAAHVPEVEELEKAMQHVDFFSVEKHAFGGNFQRVRVAYGNVRAAGTQNRGEPFEFRPIVGGLVGNGDDDAAGTRGGGRGNAGDGKERGEKEARHRVAAAVEPSEKRRQTDAAGHAVRLRHREAVGANQQIGAHHGRERPGERAGTLVRDEARRLAAVEQRRDPRRAQFAVAENFPVFGGSEIKFFERDEKRGQRLAERVELRALFLGKAERVRRKSPRLSREKRLRIERGLQSEKIHRRKISRKGRVPAKFFFSSEGGKARRFSLRSRAVCEKRKACESKSTALGTCTCTCATARC